MMNYFEFFKRNVLENAIIAGSFGRNAEIVDVIKDETEGNDQFTSTILFVTVKLKVSGILKEFSLVCKFQCESAAKREQRQSVWHFFNELLFYKEIMPLLSENVLKMVPTFYFGQATLNVSPINDVIIIENLIPRGYRQTSNRSFLDFDHCSLVFRKLGEFHGASIHLKSKDPDIFANKMKQLEETRWLDKAREEFSYYCGENAKRGVVPLLKNGKHIEILNNFICKLDDVKGMMKEILQVNEMSLLCHGDFCRNNMVFKYEDDKPVDVKFYDFGTARFGSPIIDISFFLFQNTSVDLRRKHFRDTFLNVYLAAVQSVTGSCAPTMLDLWTEFQQKAVYGYILASFFLPLMMDVVQHKMSQQVSSLSLRELIEENLQRGGQQVTDILSESVKDLIDWNCIR